MPRFQTRFHMPRLRVMALCALCLLGLGTGEVNATKTAPVAQANEPQRATLVFGIVSKEGAMGTHPTAMASMPLMRSIKTTWSTSPTR